MLKEVVPLRISEGTQDGVILGKSDGLVVG